MSASELKSFELTYCKGIEKQKFEFSIKPNRLTLMIAPNGFGKTSITHAFQSLKKNRMSFEENDYYKHDQSNIPHFILTDEDGALEASPSINKISEKYSTYVINSKLYASMQSIKQNGKQLGGTALAVESIPIYQNISQVKSLHFDFESIMSGLNIQNTSFYKGNITVFRSVMSKLLFVTDKSLIKDQVLYVINKIDNTTLSKKDLDNEIRNSIYNSIQTSVISDLCGSMSSVTKDPKKQLICLIFYYYVLGLPDFNEYANYYHLKKNADQIAEFINNEYNHSKEKVIVEDIGKDIYINFPSPEYISNGERDILSFITQLKKIEIEINNIKNGIIVIDEIFDYLDDVNIVTMQHYLSQMINSAESSDRNLYVLVFTHIDPKYYVTYSLLAENYKDSDSRLKIVYLDKYDFNDETKSEIEDLKKIIQNRKEDSIRSSLNKFYFHYYEDQSKISSCNLQESFERLDLQKNWDTPQKFLNYCEIQFNKYIDGESYNPLAIAIFIRKMIEKIAYSKIQDEASKKKFIKTCTTVKKITFAKYCSADKKMNEIYYLLGVIYNPYEHIENSDFDEEDIFISLEVPLYSKLNNLSLKKMIHGVYYTYTRL